MTIDAYAGKFRLSDTLSIDTDVEFDTGPAPHVPEPSAKCILTTPDGSPLGYVVLDIARAEDMGLLQLVGEEPQDKATADDR